MSIIEVEALAKTFRTRERAAGLAGSLRSFVAPRYLEREAVKRISFSLDPGELLAFIGPNGAGKSTLVHASNLEIRLIHEDSPNMASVIHLMHNPSSCHRWHHRRLQTC